LCNARLRALDLKTPPPGLHRLCAIRTGVNEITPAWAPQRTSAGDRWCGPR